MGHPQFSPEEIIANPELIPQLMDTIRNNRGSVKFHCAKVIQQLAEQRPALIYPYFQEVADLIDSPNSFIKWGAIITLGHLLPVDQESRFAPLYERVFSLINAESMITAGNVISLAAPVIRLHPEYEPDLTRRLLGVTGNTYWHKGQPSPECKNIVCGMVVDCFDQYFQISGSQHDIMRFVEDQLRNTRIQVVRKAEVFLRRHRAHDLLKD